MGIMQIIKKYKDDFKQKKIVEEDVRNKVRLGYIKNVSEIRKNYLSGSAGYKTAMDEYTKQQVSHIKEDVRLQEKLKQAKTQAKQPHPLMRLGLGLQAHMRENKRPLFGGLNQGSQQAPSQPQDQNRFSPVGPSPFAVQNRKSPFNIGRKEEE